jgi:hypothetical protein
MLFAAHDACFRSSRWVLFRRYADPVLLLQLPTQDYEFNSFDVALTSEDPLNPTVVLSGEVEGLKPPAVADKPMEPRLFVMNRAAEATEVVSCLENFVVVISCTEWYVLCAGFHVCA